MIGKIIGALVGSEIEKARGNSPIKGAIVGTVAVAAMRRMGPLGVALGGAYIAKKAYDRYKAGQNASGPAA